MSAAMWQPISKVDGHEPWLRCFFVEVWPGVDDGVDEDSEMISSSLDELSSSIYTCDMEDRLGEFF